MCVCCLRANLSMESSICPINDRVMSCQEWHSQQHAISSEVNDKEAMYYGLAVVRDFEIGSCMDTSNAILGSVDISNYLRFREVINGKVEAIYNGGTYKIISCTAIY